MNRGTSPGVHKQCQLRSVAQDLANRFSKNTSPNMYDIDETFHLHGVERDHLTEEELAYFRSAFYEVSSGKILVI